MTCSVPLLIITSSINTVNRYKIFTKCFSFASKDWIFRPDFAADMQMYLKANFNIYPCEVKSNRKIVTVIDLAVDKHLSLKAT